MARINTVNRSEVDQATAETLAAVESKLGMVPNLFSTLAHSPAALNGYLGLHDTLGQGQLGLRQRETIALTVAQLNGCGYCLSAHSLLGANAGLDDRAISNARRGAADDEFDNAIASFAKSVTTARGDLSDSVIEEYAGRGLTPALMVEIIANVVLNQLTNFVNNLADTDIDFPKVEVDLPAAA